MRSRAMDSAWKWGRTALKFGLLVTDAKLWTSIGEQLKDGAADFRGEAHRRYEDTGGRLRDAHTALQGRSDWLTPSLSFVGGMGIGVGLGLLLAPVSGEEARAVLRDKVVDIKNRVSDVAADATGIRARSIESGT